jgi:hypothetical protein
MSIFSFSAATVKRQVRTFCEENGYEEPAVYFPPPRRGLGDYLLSDFSMENDVLPTLPRLLGRLSLYEMGKFNRLRGVSPHGNVDWLFLKGVELDSTRLPEVAAIVGGTLENMQDTEFGTHKPLRMKLYSLNPEAQLQAVEFIGYGGGLLGTCVSLALPPLPDPRPIPKEDIYHWFPDPRHFRPKEDTL